MTYFPTTYMVIEIGLVIYVDEKKKLKRISELCCCVYLKLAAVISATPEANGVTIIQGRIKANSIDVRVLFKDFPFYTSRRKRFILPYLFFVQI